MYDSFHYKVCIFPFRYLLSFYLRRQKEKASGRKNPGQGIFNKKIPSILTQMMGIMMHFSPSRN